MGLQLHETRMGVRFYEVLVPQIATALSKMAHTMEEEAKPVESRRAYSSTEDEILVAREKFACARDDVEIDDDAVSSRGDDGRWVSAWVWVTDEDMDQG